MVLGCLLITVPAGGWASLTLVVNFVVLTLGLFLLMYTAQMTGDLSKATSGLRARYGSAGLRVPEHLRFIECDEQGASK